MAHQENHTVTPYFVPTMATTLTGRNVQFVILAYILLDLRHFNSVTFQQYTDMLFWVESYRTGGDMPGGRLFFSPYSGDMVKFVMLLDHLLDMWLAALSEQNTTPDDDGWTWEDWPRNFGRFSKVHAIAWRNYPCPCPACQETRMVLNWEDECEELRRVTPDWDGHEEDWSLQSFSIDGDEFEI